MLQTCTNISSFNKFILFIYFTYLFLAALGLRHYTQAFSSCGEQGLLFIAVPGLLNAVASLVAEHGLQAHGLQQLWLAGSIAQAHQLWHTNLVAPRHVGSSWTRARTGVPCIGRQILNHCATREAQRYKYLLICQPKTGKQPAEFIQGLLHPPDLITAKVNMLGTY